MTGYPALIAAADPDAVFVVDTDGPHTYGHVLERVSERSRRRQAGTVVPVAPANTLGGIVEVLSVWAAGGVVQLVNRRLTEAEARSQLAATGTEDGAALWDGHPGAALVVATSGTSGRPRLVQLTWENLLAAADASRRHLDHRPDDRWLAVLPLFHVGGLSIVTRTMTAGSSLLIRPRFDPNETAADLRSVTLASMVGAMLPPLVAQDPSGRTRLRAVLVGGGPTPEKVLESAWAAGIPALSTYGMTETAGQVATAPLGDGPRRRALPLPGAEIRIGHRNEIEVRGPMVSPGYLGSPPRSGDEWLSTGDTGSIDSEGFLRVHGRLSDLIVTGGENVMPAEVEAALESLDGVEEVAVFGIPDERWGEVVAAAIVGTAQPASLETALRARLAGYKLPRRWLRVEALPRNILGKVDRAALVRMAS